MPDYKKGDLLNFPSAGGGKRVKVIDTTGDPSKDFRTRSVWFCNFCMQFPPGRDEIEEALQHGETAIESWHVWRCKCGNPMAGGFTCSCGWNPSIDYVFPDDDADGQEGTEEEELIF
jgi:hypothetical protein